MPAGVPPYFSAMTEILGVILRILSCLFPYQFHTIYSQGKEVDPRTVRERILALKLLEKQERNPEYAKRIGIQVDMIMKDPKKVY